MLKLSFLFVSFFCNNFIEIERNILFQYYKGILYSPAQGDNFNAIECVFNDFLFVLFLSFHNNY